ncbi:MAG: hypothetical protein LBE24_01670 [Methylobacillus sp.]|nr:hypothetical protein [Methylobacillus sp.]
MGRLLLILLAGVVIFLLFKQARRGTRPPPRTPPREESMVACKVCGVHLPRSESVLRKGEYYCCKEHSEQA